MRKDGAKLLWADWLAITIYFVFTIGLGLAVKFRRRRENESAESFFLAGRSLVWWMVGGSIFGSNIGGTHFIGIAGDGAATGIAVVCYEWQASWTLLVLGYFFIPVYLKSGIYTMPEYIQKRYKSQSMRTILTIIALLSYVFTKISIDIYAGCLFFKEALGWNIYLSASIILTITAIYVIVGGLEAVTITDILQVSIMIIGAVVLTILGFKEIGGIEKLWEEYPKSFGRNWRVVENVTNLNETLNKNSTNSCYGLTKYWGNMFRPFDDADYPWFGLWFALPIIEIWYWCTDQVMVQRALAAKNVFHAKAGAIFAGFLKILPMFIMVMPGMISRVLFKDEIACPDAESCERACGNKLSCSNLAYPKLVFNLLPTGLVGLMMAVMLAAVMSSLSSVYNSASTVFTMDIWQRIRPRAGDREKIIVGRIMVAVLVILGIAWLPFIERGGSGRLFRYIQTINFLLGSPMMAIFFVGLVWHRANQAGALGGFAAGVLLAAARFATEYIYSTPACGEADNRPTFASINFMYFGIILFVVTVVVMIVLSLLTKPIPIEELDGLTWATLRKGEENRIVVENNENLEACEKHDIELKQPGEQVEICPSQETLDTEDVLYQSRNEKIICNVCSVILLLVLLFLWVWYR